MMMTTTTTTTTKTIITSPTFISSSLLSLDSLLLFPSSTSSSSSISFPLFSRRSNCRLRIGCFSHQSAISRRNSSDNGSFDPELRSVLELATDSELYELERILFGPSYFSPLLKSMTNGTEEVDYIMIGEDFEERQDFIELLESRFLYLGADARSTLRGWRPSYRDILLSVRRKLSVPCSSKLATEDLEVEIFLHLLQEYSSGETDISYSWKNSSTSSSHETLQLGLSQWKVQALAALKIGAVELKSMILKGGGMFTLAKIYQLLARRLSGKMLFEAANVQMKHKLLRESGKLAAINLESRAALLAARQEISLGAFSLLLSEMWDHTVHWIGLAGVASRYLGIRSMMMFLGPMLWGTFLADVVIQMLGTDYARILRAIYAFAQIRVTRTYKLESDKNQLI